MTKLLLVLAAIVGLMLFIVLEGRRQRRSMERRGTRTGERPSLIGTGMLELQSMLEPDRKVETIQAEMRERDRVHPEHHVARPAADADEHDSGTADDASDMAARGDRAPH